MARMAKAFLGNEASTLMDMIDGDEPDKCYTRAVELNADIIVYGTLDARTNPGELHLRFCTYNEKFQDRGYERGIGNFEELQGVDRLGSPLRVDLPIGKQQDVGDRLLEVRAALVARLLLGLSYELSGSDLQVSVRSALKTFQEALANLNDAGVVADESLSANGGDLLFYFIGREYFLLFQDKSTSAAEKPGDLENARLAFQRATDLNPQYARAWSALGSAYYLKARQDSLDNRPATKNLEQSIGAYQKAIPAAQASQDKAAETEALLALAQAYWLQADAFLRQNPSDVAAALAALDQAKQQVDLGEAMVRAEQVRLQGYAAMIRGLIAHWHAQISLRAGDKLSARAQFEQAGTYYQLCIRVGEKDAEDLFLQRQIINDTCRPENDSVARALQQLQ
jgi:hypothetical protein